MKYKIIVMDRNGRTSKFVVKDEPIITENTIELNPTPWYKLVFVIQNLTSYSITTLNPKRDKEDKEDEEEQVHL